MAEKIGFPKGQSVVEVSRYSVNDLRKQMQKEIAGGKLSADTDVNLEVKKRMVSDLTLIHKMLGMMRTHTSREFLWDKYKFCTVRRDGKSVTVQHHKSYEQYQLGHYATDVSAVRVDGGRYGTMHNPAIYIEPESEKQAQHGIEHPEDAVGNNLAMAVIQVAHKVFNNEELTKDEQVFYERHESKILDAVFLMRTQQGDSLAAPELPQLHLSTRADSDGKYLTAEWLSDRAERLWPGDDQMQAAFLDNLAPWLRRVPKDVLESSLIGSVLFKDDLTKDEAQVLRMC